MRIGIDFGGVLAQHGDTSASGEHTNSVVNMPGAIDAIQQLHELGHELFIVSFCGKQRAYESFMGLKKTGLSGLFTHQYYVKKTDYKTFICRHFGCNVMIDDREDILDTISPGTTTVLFGEADAINKRHIWCKTWADVVAFIASCEFADVTPEDIPIERYLNHVQQ